MSNPEHDPIPIGQSTSDFKWVKTDPLWIPEISKEHHSQYERMKRELDIENRAQNDGSQNIPSPGDTALNALQAGIQARVLRGVELLNQFLREQLGKSAQGMMPPEIRIDAEVRKQEAEATLPNTENLPPPLVNGFLALLEAERQLKHFRARHKLTRPAHYWTNPFLFPALLLFITLCESLANAGVLQEISSQGFLGGYVFAFLISVVNVGVGFFGGCIGWRLLGWRFWPIKYFIGGTVTTATLLFAVFWNFVVAHFREVAVAAAHSQGDLDLSILAQQTQQHILDHGLSGLDLISWLLLAIGFLTFTFAAFKSWDGIGDRYWDYKKIDKAYKDANDELDEEFATFEAELTDRLDLLSNNVSAAKEAARHHILRASALADLAEQRYQEVRASQLAWVNEGNRLLQLYREENEKVRNVEVGLPTYWNNYPKLHDYFVMEDASQLPASIGLPTLPDPEPLTNIRLHRKALAAIAENNDHAVNEVQRYIASIKAKCRGEMGVIRTRVEDAAKAKLTRISSADPD